ncbi:MAG: LacI family DNA-binding transcriptional regulator [Chloroflexi bacterium]|nr:LacI family DNA-binding transcriptional regulator [Chloroflexota bacterium]
MTDAFRQPDDGHHLPAGGHPRHADDRALPADGQQASADGLYVPTDGRGDGQQASGDGQQASGDGQQASGDGQQASGDGQRSAHGTIYDIAERAGVSLSTVSRCLNQSGYVGAATRTRIEAAIRDLDYQPSQAARALAGQRSGIVVLAVPGIANPQWPEVAMAMEERLAEAGLSLIVANAIGRARELAVLDQVRRMRADGLAISATRFEPHDFDRLRRSGVHIISLSRDIDDPSLDSVLPDRPRAIMLAIEHLALLGHRRIAMVHGVGGPVAKASRIAAYRSAREWASLSDEPELLVEVAEPTMVHGERAAADVLRLGATAVVASGDFLAIGVWLGLEEAGCEIPRDVSIVGMDDIEAAALVRGGLTTVALDRHERGRLIADLLLDRIAGTASDGPRHLVVRPRLVLRHSTALPPQHTTSSWPASRATEGRSASAERVT